MLPNWTRIVDIFERFVVAAERLASAAEQRNRILAGAMEDTAEDTRPVMEVNGHGRT